MAKTTWKKSIPPIRLEDDEVRLIRPTHRRAIAPGWLRDYGGRVIKIEAKAPLLRAAPTEHIRRPRTLVIADARPAEPVTVQSPSPMPKQCGNAG